MKFLLFSLLTMVPATLAATCSDGHVYNEALYWELRQQMCNNEKCQYQKECEVQQDSPNGWIIKLQRKNRGGKAGFPSCWAATESIIGECVRKGKGTGVWESNEEYFKFTSL